MVPAPSNAADYPATFNEFITRFGTEEACRQYVEAVCWRDGFACHLKAGSDRLFRVS